MQRLLVQFGATAMVRAQVLKDFSPLLLDSVNGNVTCFRINHKILKKGIKVSGCISTTCVCGQEVT